MEPNRPDLYALVNKWARIMRLQDWVIGIVYKRHYEMDDGKGGTVVWCVRKKNAWITILDPIDYQHNPEECIPPDVELTVVHELTHLQFALLDDMSLQGLKEDVFEQAVHDISSALVLLDRRGK